MADLVQRLKERKLVQWALAYVAAAFALMQGADIVATRFALPEGVVRGLIVVLAIGFFVTIVLAWYHGEKGAQRVGGTELLFLALLLAIGGGLLWRVSSGEHENAPSAAAAPARTGASDTSSIPAKSIAVLPFENLSRDPDNAYFAEGIQDEILTRLAKIGALKVISRTSTQQYAAKPPNLPEAARQLGVANVLEGSVQKAGNAVHVNVQLIRAATDEHLWAESYNRALDDVFAVEAEIAQAVAEALNAKLQPEEHARATSAPTQNPEAHELFLRASPHFLRANEDYIATAVEEPQAIALFEAALKKDPAFALAWADLSTAHMYMYWFGLDRTDARLSSAKVAADKALELQPDLGEAHYALGLHHYWGSRDYASALAELALARKTWPNSAEVEQIDAAISRRQGDFERAIEGFRRAGEFDPRNPSPAYDQGLTNAHLRRYEEAERLLLHAASLSGAPSLQLGTRAEAAAFRGGDLTLLRNVAEALVPGTDEYTASARYVFELAWWSRDFAAAAKITETDSTRPWFEVTNITLPLNVWAAYVHATAGETARAQKLAAALEADLAARSRARPEDADLHLALGFTFAVLGRKSAAMAEAGRAMLLIPVDRDAVTGPAVMGFAARIYTLCGAKREAIDLLRQVLALPAGFVASPASLKFDPSWDPLRGDPQFEALTKAATTTKDAPRG